MSFDDWSSEGWAQLRATRSDPPAAASTADRRRTYVLALEQAQQMFSAARTVGPAARPLLLFYGLSQAGRAVAAAARSVTRPDGWQLTGHGINALQLGGPLPDVAVATDMSERGSFTRLSRILGSPVWDKSTPIPLGPLWNSLPDTRAWPMPFTGIRRPALLFADPFLNSDATMSAGNIAYLPPELLAATPRMDAFLEFMASYPTAASFYAASKTIGSEQVPLYQPHVDGWAEVRLSWMHEPNPTPTEAEHRAYLHTIAADYEGSLFIFPAVGANTAPLHPLMTWWAVLYALSMLARYQPGEWGRHIDVDSSPLAVTVEHLLRRAVGVIPTLIRETIAQVA